MDVEVFAVPLDSDYYRELQYDILPMLLEGESKQFLRKFYLMKYILILHEERNIGLLNPFYHHCLNNKEKDDMAIYQDGKWFFGKRTH